MEGPFFEVAAQLIALLFLALVFERHYFERKRPASAKRLSMEVLTLFFFVVGEGVALAALLGIWTGRTATAIVVVSLAFGGAVLVVPLVAAPARELQKAIEVTQSRTAAVARPFARWIVPAVTVAVIVVFAGIVALPFISARRAAEEHHRYGRYMDGMRGLAERSARIGRDLERHLTAPRIEQGDLVVAIDALGKRHERVVASTVQIRPPGPLREEHEAAIEALQLRVAGLDGLAAAFEATRDLRDAGTAGALLASQAERIAASNVVWADLFVEPAREELARQGISGVAVPDSTLLGGGIASPQWMTALWQRIHGSAAGLRGLGLVSVHALPDGKALTRASDNVLTGTTDLAFVAAVENSGASQEVRVRVTLTLGDSKSTRRIRRHAVIPAIGPGEQVDVTFRDLARAVRLARTTLTVAVAPVPAEARLENNSATYAIEFMQRP